MDFEPEYIVDLLNRRGVTDLFHANTVTTACSMLRLGALCSRAEVEAARELQTIQESDGIDREYQIWDAAFLDTSDIHRVVGSHNNYGPVLFRFSPEILLGTVGRTIRVTRVNPVNWAGLSDAQRWFLTREALEAEYNPADIGQMLVVPQPQRGLGFNPHLRSVVIDNPRSDVEGENGFSLASRSVADAAASSGVVIPAIEERICAPGCSCVTNYRANYRFKYKFFLPRMGG